MVDNVGSRFLYLPAKRTGQKSVAGDLPLISSGNGLSDR
jgi:hypothetical protein